MDNIAALFITIQDLPPQKSRTPMHGRRYSELRTGK